MDFTILEKNITGTIKEGQVKLGYQKETIRLYYSLQSLQHLLKSEGSAEEIEEVLTKFAKTVEERFGTVEISRKKDRFCIAMPPKASEYVHLNTPQEGFLYDLIALVSRHGVTMDEISALFEQYSDQVFYQATKHGEFDYLLYFKDGKPDDYRYCFKEEGHHLIYHRFAPEDYDDYEFDA